MALKKTNTVSVRLILWLVMLLIVLGTYLLHPELFDIGFLQSFVADYKPYVVACYLCILSVLGLFLIPSTPFALVGVFLFGPLEAYIYNLIGILTSTMIVFWCARYVGLDRVLEARFPQKIKKIRKLLTNKEWYIICTWSMFPLVPTDLIIYAASTMRVSWVRCITAVLVGEGILNLVYIFGTDTVFTLLFG